MARPRFIPSAEQRKTVRFMAACGIRHDEIARYLSLRSPKTLRRHFREELDRGATEANARVAQCLYQMAISGTNVVATIFWLKSQARWGEHGAPRPAEAPPFIVVLEKEGA